VGDHALVIFGGYLIVSLAIGVAMTSSWKIVKRPRFLLCGACDAFLDPTISGVEETLIIRRGPNFLEGLGEEGDLS
jgi:hypothetical protein